MPYQFYCPQGHLLEGHESQTGQQSQCPLCGSMFLVPPAPGSAPPPFIPGGAMLQPPWPSGYGAPTGQFPSTGPLSDYGQAPEQPFAGVPFDAAPAVAPDPGAAGATSAVGDPAAGLAMTGTQSQQQPTDAPSETAAPSPTAPDEQKEEPRSVRIPCPQGHELHTPTDMLDQDVLCPICNAQFHLRYEDSVEFKQEHAERQRQKAEHLNRAAIKWSMVTAVVIVLGILGMILYLAARTPGEKKHLPSETPATDS